MSLFDGRSTPRGTLTARSEARLRAVTAHRAAPWIHDHVRDEPDDHPGAERHEDHDEIAATPHHRVLLELSNGAALTAGARGNAQIANCHKRYRVEVCAHGTDRLASLQLATTRLDW